MQRKNNIMYSSHLSLLNYVGIRYEFLCDLEEIDDWFSAWLQGEYVNHLKDLIKRNMSEKCSNGQVEDILYGLGFTRERAKLLAKWITGEAYSSHQSLLYFAMIYLENKLSQIVLCSPCAARPYHCSTLLFQI